MQTIKKYFYIYFFLRIKYIFNSIDFIWNYERFINQYLIIKIKNIFIFIFKQWLGYFFLIFIRSVVYFFLVLRKWLFAFFLVLKEFIRSIFFYLKIWLFFVFSNLKKIFGVIYLYSGNLLNWLYVQTLRPFVIYYRIKIKEPTIKFIKWLNYYPTSDECKEDNKLRKKIFGLWKVTMVLNGFLFYCLFSFTDYVIIVKKDIWAANASSVMPLAEYLDWVEPSYFYQTSFVFSYLFYRFLVFLMPFNWGKLQYIRDIYISCVLCFTIGQHWQYWEIAFETFFDMDHGPNVLAWVGYFIGYWAHIFVQWGIEMEEDIDEQDEEVNKQRVAAGLEPLELEIGIDKWKDQLILYTFMNIGTNGEYPEPPSATFDRFLQENTDRFGAEFVYYYLTYKAPPALREIVDNVSNLKYVYMYYFGNPKRQFYRTIYKFRRFKWRFFNFLRFIYYWPKFISYYHPAAGIYTPYWPKKFFWRQTVFPRFFRSFKSWSYSPYKHRRFSQFLFTH